MASVPRIPVLTIALVLAGAAEAFPQDAERAETEAPGGPAAFAPSAVPAPPAALRDPAAPPASELAPLVVRYTEDRGVLLRSYDLESPWRRERLAAFLDRWEERLAAVPFEGLETEGRIDWLLLGNELRHERRLTERQARWEAEMEPLVPFLPELVRLHRARRELEVVDPVEAAAALSEAAERVRAVRDAVRRGLDEDGGGVAGGGAAGGTGGGGAAEGQEAEVLRPDPVVARRAATRVETLRETLGDWFRHHDGYDPMFSWWTRAPWRALDEALEAYLETLRRDVLRIREGEPEPIIGEPIGRQALLEDLEHEMIPYSPEELLEIAERELAWGEEAMREAAREMGYGDDWRAALEEVKQRHVPPGDQPQLVVELAREAEAFLSEHGLVTVPPLASEVWRMEMLSPERQRVAPFFLGGEVVRVAFPTEAMSHEEKWMSLRANNVHFSRAVVHHELIPGHHLQGFMTRRYSPHRSAFSTPFWGEGWALYWELLLWDRDFPRTPEDRIGMLFWRNHRAARILFSLGFHLGEMTPEECVELLVERVGHERASAEAEVRRSFAGDYPPLYQAAYLLGGLQLRALHGEMVGSGRMTDREFHDRVLRSGRMPIEMVRASLREEPPPRDFRPAWRFYEALRGGP